jgi:hypothetical protein
LLPLLRVLIEDLADTPSSLELPGSLIDLWPESRMQKVISQFLSASELQFRFRTLHRRHYRVQYGLLHFVIVPGSPLYDLLPDESLLNLVPLPLLDDSFLLDLYLLYISQLVINKLLYTPPPRVVEVRVDEVVLGLAHMLLFRGYLV